MSNQLFLPSNARARLEMLRQMHCELQSQRPHHQHGFVAAARSVEPVWPFDAKAADPGEVVGPTHA